MENKFNLPAWKALRVPRVCVTSLKNLQQLRYHGVDPQTFKPIVDPLRFSAVDKILVADESLGIKFLKTIFKLKKHVFNIHL